MLGERLQNDAVADGGVGTGKCRGEDVEWKMKAVRAWRLRTCLARWVLLAMTEGDTERERDGGGLSTVSGSTRE